MSIIQSLPSGSAESFLLLHLLYYQGKVAESFPDP